mmetsp:Transcript_33397/g.92233  ORF Transcript_33397/g.92233 Transcript_33397/m.92233 type:complete len:655 (-) Transcript_33397:225-2189(-)|eukprot:CAMPEP_0117600046 /NCGR_PEP_ID=MMETSP0784-20121206/76270_1 /TAXON_ID=39447 /ORGANISM="" /LENGTH=654 /DNA_ID=CAMNT_0005402635 /DNA_START=74 /DNA_END=2038 /DNA_ORIENTATION=-
MNRSRSTGVLPGVQRRNGVSSTLRRVVGQNIASPLNRRSPGLVSKSASRTNTPTSLPPLTSPKGLLVKKGATKAMLLNPSAEVCAVCLDPLDDNDFLFPCGQQHRLHGPCAIHFLGCALSLPASKDVPGPLPIALSRSMGTGFRALDCIETAIGRATPASMARLCCPLCRGAWPVDDPSLTSSTFSQLRMLSARRLEPNASRMACALAHVVDRSNDGEEFQRARQVKGLIAFDENRHSASSFFAMASRRGDVVSTAILRFLRCCEVYRLSGVATSCGRLNRSGSKLRVPTFKIGKEKIRAAVPHVSGSKLEALAVSSSGASMWSRCGVSVSATDMEALSRWLSPGTRLRELSLIAFDLEKLDAGGQHLAQCLANKQLRVLDLSQNSLSDATLTRLASVLAPPDAQAAQSLEVLILDLNCISAAGLSALLPLGRKGSRLREWGLKHNQIGDAGCRAIADAAFGPASLDLRTNGITAAGCEDLSRVFGNMVVARLGCNALGDAGAVHLAMGFGNRLEVLDLRQAQIGDDGIGVFGRLLCCAPSLQELLLQGNKFGASGAQALADGWACLKSLHSVDLSNNLLGSNGVTMIAEELHFWIQAPFRLSLMGVGCEDEGAISMKSALETHDRRGRGWAIELQNNFIGNPNHVLDIRRLLE